MKFAKWIVMGSGGIVLAVATLFLISPKAAHAITATLVQITNTTANPVPVFNTGHVAYQEVAEVNSCGQNSCSRYWPAVPSGFRLVVQNISGALVVPSSETIPPAITLGMGYSEYAIPGVVGPGLVGAPGWSIGAVNGNVVAYLAAGQQPYVTIYATGPVNGSVTLTGYLENCAITGCP